MNMIASMGVVGNVLLSIRILSVSSVFRSGSNLKWSGSVTVLGSIDFNGS